MVGSVNNNGNSTPVFNMSGNNVTIQSSGSGANYAGQMFIFTDPTYSGLAPQTAGWPATGAPPNLHQGSVVDNAASNQNGFTQNLTQNITLSGYNAKAPTAPSGVLSEDYNGFLFWQDRNNSTIKYNPDGSFNCAAPYNTASCTKPLSPAQN